MSNKIILDKNLTMIFFLWSSFIFSLGFVSGYLSPSELEFKMYSYSVLLENENYYLNKKIKDCKSHSDMIEYKGKVNSEEIEIKEK